MEIIGHGAEATIYKVTEQNGNCKVVKQRLPKKYRHPDLDKKLNQSRVKSEAKIIQKLFKKGMKVPQLYKVDQQNYTIQMQFLQGKKLKDYLNSKELTHQGINEVLEKLGKVVQRLHDLGVIHGDLTTSNMIYLDQEIYLIDFGLSHIKNSIEDRAVDLYVLQRAFISTHPQLQKQFNKVLISYGEQSVIKRLQIVRQRGRKKIAFG